MRMCSGSTGGWLGGSVVGLGGSHCTELLPPAICRDLDLGGDGGMWEGGGSWSSAGFWDTVAFVRLSLLSLLGTGGGAAVCAEGGSEELGSEA